MRMGPGSSCAYIPKKFKDMASNHFSIRPSIQLPRESRVPQLLRLCSSNLFSRAEMFQCASPRHEGDPVLSTTEYPVFFFHDRVVLAVIAVCSRIIVSCVLYVRSVATSMSSNRDLWHDGSSLCQIQCVVRFPFSLFVKNIGDHDEYYILHMTSKSQYGGL